MNILSSELQSARPTPAPVPAPLPAPAPAPAPVVAAASAPSDPVDEQARLVQELLQMGFQNDIKTLIRVLTETGNNIERAIEVLSTSPLPASPVAPAVGGFGVDQELRDGLRQLKEMGFTDEAANASALKEAKGDVRVALIILTS